jgi:hypothetical protein
MAHFCHHTIRHQLTTIRHQLTTSPHQLTTKFSTKKTTENAQTQEIATLTIASI